MRWLTLGLLGGCVPTGGVFLSELASTDPIGGSPVTLGEIALREHASLDLSTPLFDADDAWNYIIESSDPSVVAVASFEDLIVEGEDLDPSEFVSDQAIWISQPDEGDDSVSVRLSSGREGQATLSLVDITSGETVDTVDIEVRRPALARAVPVGAARWHTLADLDPLSVEGSTVAYEIVTTDEMGRRLAGSSDPLLVYSGISCDPAVNAFADSKMQRECAEHLYEPGLHTIERPGLPPVTFEVVAASEIASIELREHITDDVRSEVLVVGIDREGRTVRGLISQWIGSKNDSTGDLYLYDRHESARASAVTASWNGLRASTHVQQEAPGEVRLSDDTSCSTAGGAPAWLLALTSLLAVGARRRVIPARRPVEGRDGRRTLL